MPPPPPHPVARLLGYSLVLGFFLLLFLLAAGVFREARHTDRTLLVHFPEIATLSAGDPVVENGVAIGKVRRIALENGLPVAELQLFHHRFLAEDTRFVNFSHSLMGARKVWLLPGTSQHPLDEARLQAGVFAPGLPETLHKVRALTENVALWRKRADALLSENGERSFVAQARLEEAQRKLTALAASLDGAATVLQSGITTVVAAGEQAQDLLHGADAGLEQADQRVHGLLSSLENTKADLAVVLTQAERLAAVLEDSTGTGKLLTDRALYESLVRHVETLTKAAKLLHANGLGDSLKVRPRF